MNDSDITGPDGRRRTDGDVRPPETTPALAPETDPAAPGDLERAAPPAPEPAPEPEPEPAPRRGGAASSTWVALIIGALLLILLLVFIMQNQQSVELHLFGWTWNFPLGVGLLLASIIGGLIMACAGIWKMVEMRRRP